MLRPLAALCLLLVAAAPLSAQSPAPSGFRQIAPGVINTIPAEVLETEKTSRHDIVEILAAMSDYGVRPGSVDVSPAKNVRFTETVQALEFSFKPVRFIRVNLPVEGGGTQSTLVWYMVYYVRNPGDKPMRFVPQFSLSDLETEGDAHVDKLLAPAVAAIREREDPRRPLLNAVEISAHDIPPSSGEQDGTVWGVVTWDDINPQMDKFAVSIEGLSTAYRWEDAEGGYQPGDPIGTGRKLTFKTLVLNFWRPGDAFYEHESEIRYGIPGEVDYRWVYQ